MQGIVDFCELGDFLDQPFKTYSLGMQARLMFASATAIKPDILIVDEVLGAGDAYFVAKSKTRVESMISAGCTMLLVSHSMQQVLELCDEVIWMEQGSIKMRGESLLVVKAYEESLHGRMKALVGNAAPEQSASAAKPIQSTSLQESGMPARMVSSLERGAVTPELQLQKPVFLPHQFSWSFPELSESDRREFRHVARGGLSRWDSERGVKLAGFSIMTEQGIDNRLRVLHPAKFVLTLEAEVSGHYSCMYGIVLNDSMGNVAARIWSPADEFDLLEGQSKQIEMLFNPVQLGPGEYTIGISVLESAPIEKLNTTRRFDLLGRSFFCTVDMDESLAAASANFIHTAEWSFS
jgi:lipopolysaccharide transport system ATP-binding protein